MIQVSGIEVKNIIFILLCGWLMLWSASAVQDVVIWATGTSEKVWVLDVDNEYSFYTWFSTLLLGLAAVLAFVLASSDAEKSRKFKKQWGIIGVIFLMLSMDEMLSFHERLSGMLSGALSTTGIFAFAWVIPALFVVTAVSFMFWPFMRQLPYPVARTIVISGGLYVAGAVGMEMMAGLFISQSEAGSASFTLPLYRLLANVEEGLEVLGVIVFIKALLMQAELYFSAFISPTEQPMNKPRMQSIQLLHAAE